MQIPTYRLTTNTELPTYNLSIQGRSWCALTASKESVTEPGPWLGGLEKLVWSQKVFSLLTSNGSDKYVSFSIFYKCRKSQPPKI